MPEAVDVAADAAHLLPRAALALAVLLAGALFARTAVKALTTQLQRAGFVQLVERGAVRKLLSRSKYDAATVVGKVVYAVVLGLLAAAALTVLAAVPLHGRVADVLFGPYPVLLLLAAGVAVVARSHETYQTATNKTATRTSERR